MPIGRVADFDEYQDATRVSRAVHDAGGEGNQIANGNGLQENGLVNAKRHEGLALGEKGGGVLGQFLRFFHDKATKQFAVYVALFGENNRGTPKGKIRHLWNGCSSSGSRARLRLFGL